MSTPILPQDFDTLPDYPDGLTGNDAAYCLYDMALDRVCKAGVDGTLTWRQLTECAVRAVYCAENHDDLAVRLEELDAIVMAWRDALAQRELDGQA